MGSLVAVFLLACGGGSSDKKTEQPPPPPADVSYYVNAGATDDLAGTDWKADAYFTGGSTYSNTETIDLSYLSDPKPPVEIFATERYDESTYTFPGLTAGKTYNVTLYFEESYVTTAGARVFSAEINGAAVLTDFDIYAEAAALTGDSGSFVAIEKKFEAVASDAGEIVLHFTKNVENPKICGIKVTPKA